MPLNYCSEDTTVSVKIAPSQIIVEDNGGGVEPEDLKKLGQRFYRPAGQMKGKWFRAFYCHANCGITRIQSAVRKCFKRRAENWLKGTNIFIDISFKKRKPSKDSVFLF